MVARANRTLLAVTFAFNLKKKTIAPIRHTIRPLRSIVSVRLSKHTDTLFTYNCNTCVCLRSIAFSETSQRVRRSAGVFIFCLAHFRTCTVCGILRCRSTFDDEMTVAMMKKCVYPARMNLHTVYIHITSTHTHVYFIRIAYVSIPSMCRAHDTNETRVCGKCANVIKPIYNSYS